MKFLPDDVGAIERMWVSPKVRGFGLGKRLLTELADHARVRGVRRPQLETKGELYEAIQMYQSLGYRKVEPFNDEYYADHWLDKAPKCTGGEAHSPSRMSRPASAWHGSRTWSPTSSTTCADSNRTTPSRRLDRCPHGQRHLIPTLRGVFTKSAITSRERHTLA